MRCRIWQEHTARVLPALGTDGPLSVRPGEVVVVAIVADYEQAAAAMQALAEPVPKHRGKR